MPSCFGLSSEKFVCFENGEVGRGNYFFVGVWCRPGGGPGDSGVLWRRSFGHGRGRHHRRSATRRCCGFGGLETVRKVQER